MVNSRTKRVIVIKDIHSNIIEEAILILKSDPEKKTPRGGIVKKKEINKELLIAEANTIIENYIRERRIKAIREGKLGFLKKLFYHVFTKNVIINIFMGAGLFVLIFLLTRLLGSN